MLTTTRREIVNDYEISQNRQLRNFASDYAYEEEMTENRFENKMEIRPVENYISRSEIAQKLYGSNYNEHYEAIHDEENYSDPDLMPSMTTMQISRSANYQQPAKSETKVASKQGYSTRNKILIASYAAVVLAFALIITLTIVSISSLFLPAQTQQPQAQPASVEVADSAAEQTPSMAEMFDMQ